MTDGEDSDDILSINRQRWNALVENRNEWTVPVTPKKIADARDGEWSIVLTPAKPVPNDWFPDFNAANVDVLCLAGAGGQQAPILAAAGASVTVLDNSDRQLAQDQLVAQREGLQIETLQGDMRDLSCFVDRSFDLIVHPCSNCFVPDIRPVWNEAFRVLRTGGSLMSGFTNPVRYLFDEDLLEKGDMKVAYKIPFSDLKSLNEQQQKRYAEKNEPLVFGHTLEDQIAGQLDAGFAITSLFEDRYSSENDVLSKHIATFIATLARKQ